VKRRAVIVERAAHRRLRIVDALRAEYQVDAIEMLDGFVRTVRAIRPEIVLIGVGRRVQQSTRAAHQIKTDGTQPPLVGMMDWDGRLRDPVSKARDAMADGVFLGAPSSEELQRFVVALGEQEDVVIMGERPSSPWKRFLGR